MKKIYLLFVFILSFTVITAQRAWTWINGKNTANTAASYGYPGKPAASNNPGSRTQSVQWKDQEGNLWLFGGQTFGPTATTYMPPPMLLSDLWKYDMSTGNWIWMTGDTIPNQAGRYRATPNPGARRGALSWTDANGVFWMFGGYGYSAERIAGYLNDLWQYTAAKGWIWMGGSTGINAVGQYAALNTETGKNVPGARSESVGWSDPAGYLWMFGGYGYGIRDTGMLNDLWKLNIKTGEWTWVDGNGGTNIVSAYHARVNRPGGRSAAVSWLDKSGSLWLFGGLGYDTKQKGMLSDLWQFDPASGEWNVMGGNETVDQLGQYGKQGTSSAKNKPGGRMDAFSWVDNAGDCWLFGGNGYGSTKNGYMADLWMFNIKNSAWTWVKGSDNVNVAGIYGKQHVIDTNNNPGGRAGGVCWIDKTGLPWIFGGLGFTDQDGGYLNDLWRMNIVQAPVQPLLSCPASRTLQNDTSCSVNVYGIDPVLLNSSLTTVYTYSGASSGSGKGSVSGLVFNPGITTVVYKLSTDTFGCRFNIEIQDQKAPVPIADTLADIIGDCIVTVKDRPKAKDNCAGIVQGSTADALSYSKQGIYIIHWLYKDNSGNSSTQTQRVMVRGGAGTLTPLLAKLPDVKGECSVTVSDVPMAAKNCAGIFMATTTDPLTYTRQGEYMINWTYNDYNGTIIHQQQKVIVKDSTKPVPATDTLPDIIGECTVTVKNSPKAIDNCSGNIIGTTTDATTYSQTGSYIVHWNYNDGNGNIAVQQQRVIVHGGSELKPVIAALPDISAGCSVTVTDFPKASATCGAMVTASTTDPLIYQQQGVYMINWHYNDGFGNVLNQTQKVVVKDITAPVPELQSLPDINGKCSVTITDKPVAYDDCAGKIIATTKDPLVYRRQGTYTINWEFNDGNGNVRVQQQKVMLKMPVALAPGPVVLPRIMSECAYTVTSRPTIQDYCLGTVTAFTTDSLTYTQPGDYTLTWKFITGSGDTIIQKQPITVRKLSLTVNAWPNPSSNYFTMTIKTCNNNEKIMLRVYDVLGRITENRMIKPFETVVLGEHYSNAAYFVQVIQGGERITHKLIKTN